jgi:hypothetical protein
LNSDQELSIGELTFSSPNIHTPTSARASKRNNKIEMLLGESDFESFVFIANAAAKAPANVNAIQTQERQMTPVKEDTEEHATTKFPVMLDVNTPWSFT